jgi:hypothetical protein
MTDFSVVALAKTPREGALEAKPGRFGDCRENPCCKKADLDDTGEDLMAETKEAIVGLVLLDWMFTPGKDKEGKVAEKVKEAMC